MICIFSALLDLFKGGHYLNLEKFFVIGLKCVIILTQHANGFCAIEFNMRF